MLNAISEFFSKIIILNPQGIIALKERNLMIVAVLLMLIVVIPVFVFTFYIVFKYRVNDRTQKGVADAGVADAIVHPKKALKYDPEWDHNIAVETLWWGIPCIIILILSIITWKSSYDISPYKPLVSDVPPITIQVVALDWKWLFIYPAQGIATVNFVEFPAGTPINFEVTSDAPMNSFWIPQLAGQIYAMPGMSTQLHLNAFAPGSYNGFSANISGAGFSGMKFIAQSVSTADFDQWVASVQQSSFNSPNSLDTATYKQLALPSENNPIAFYSSVDPSLYNEEVMKYMMPADAMMQSNTTIPDMVMPMNMQMDIPNMPNDSTPFSSWTPTPSTPPSVFGTTTTPNASTTQS
jgi:cytochrome o ubiquinol oxidase subunit 2